MTARAILFSIFMAAVSFVSLILPGTASAKEYRGMLQIGEGGECIDVPYGDFTTGRALIIHRCQNTTNQYFHLRDDGHLVANNGQPNAQGVLMCVESDGRTPRLAPCRRLTRGDRQWWWRTPYGYLQNNVTSERRGSDVLPYNECIADPVRGIGAIAELKIVNCWESSGIQYKGWFPFPYSDTDRAYDQAREAVARRANERAGYYLPQYDPEKRSRLEDAVTAYGPYVVVKDLRTGLCLYPHASLPAIVTGTCGKGTQRFHLSADGLLRQITSDKGYRGVTGQCAASPLRQGGFIELQSCNAGQIRQRWWITNGMIQSRATPNLCWDVANEARNAGVYLIGWPCDTGRRPGHQAFGITYERNWQQSGL